MSVKIRQVYFWIHSYSGLTMALFLFIASITGALLAFHEELDDKNIAPFQEVYVNPYSSEIIGSRDKEAWAWNNTMWKVFWSSKSYQQHRQLKAAKM